MEKTVLGRTGLEVTRCAFGALPLQRISAGESVGILRAAYDGGVNFFDTARAYYDSEDKIGVAFEGYRDKVIIATKAQGLTAEDYEKQLAESLARLRTDYIDIYQFHLAKKCHSPGEPDGLYDAALRAKAAGKIRHIGLTAHRLDVAIEAAKSGLYDTVQFPVSYLSSDRDLGLISVCRENNVGLIAMKALSGGLITDVRIAWLFMRRHDNVVPIWGIQKLSELEEFLAYEKNPPVWSDELREKMSRDRLELSGNFCRGCGYCLPCPAGIEINWIARMPQVLRRMKAEVFMTQEWREKMKTVENCVHCEACKARCPYELDTPKLVADALIDYMEFSKEWQATRYDL
ncbi:MAG: aldo/keto reductase [Synergistaceae bacterium]|jgi:aryl-alcohol dehydrogenase-like predicted oxidoreductase|nr:aldo/keto reductase [Synergistaceae bacterium]